MTTSIKKRGMKILIHPYTSAVQPLKFGNGLNNLIPHSTGCGLLSMLGLKLIQISKRGLVSVDDFEYRTQRPTIWHLFILKYQVLKSRYFPGI